MGEIIESLRSSNEAYYDVNNQLQVADEMDTILKKISKLTELKNNKYQTK